MTTKRDITVRNRGSTTEFTPLTTSGKITLSEFAMGETWMWSGDTLTVDTDRAKGLIDGLTKEGLVVS